MKNKYSAQATFSNLRVILILCGIASFVLTGTLLAFFRPEAPINLSQRTLSFTERVVYQRAIERVYWRHRIWPKDGPDPKPSLDAVISEKQVEKKVADYLRNSQALEDYSHRPIAPEQLQAEMDRMAKDTKQPGILHELFDALDNDPFVIAECLARPTLAEHLVASRHPNDQGIQSKSQSVAPIDLRTPEISTEANPHYQLPSISDDPNGCVDDTWTTTTTTNAPDARFLHKAIWTGSEMIVWSGVDLPFCCFPNTGGRYIPAIDSWTATTTDSAPDGRYNFTALWTGTEMIVWGGFDDSGPLNTGGRYNPTTDSWTSTSATNAPTARDEQTAVWTGTEMIVWGGWSGSAPLNTGGKYSPDTNSWTVTTTTNAPAARFLHTATWAGNEMIVWGGWDNGPSYFETGGRYNPTTNSWTVTSTSNVPSGRAGHTSVWTGGEMIVWGGADSSNFFNTGGRYDPGTNSWTPTSVSNAPSARTNHTVVWTGNEMIVWAGFDESFQWPNTGGKYDPGANSWVATNIDECPRWPRGPHGCLDGQ